MSKKIIVNTIDGPVKIRHDTLRSRIEISWGNVSRITALDARVIANTLNEFANAIGTPNFKPVRDPHSLLLVLVECMSTFDDNDPASIERTQAALLEYERSGDHNHGQGPIVPGGECSRNPISCWVARVRKELGALNKVQ